MIKIFSYGNKKVKFTHNNLYVEDVDNLHDLADYERSLDKRGVPWAVWVKVTEVSKGRHQTKYVMIAESELL